MVELDKEINYVLRKLSHLEAKEIVPILLKKGFDRQRANKLVKFFEENKLAELSYSNELRFIKVPESPENVQLKDLTIKATITPKGKVFLKEHRSFRDRILDDWKKWLIFVMPTLIIALFINHFFLNAESMGQDTSSINFTVFVHGPAGEDDLILTSQGKVVLVLKSDKREASINEKGEATFKEIPLNFNNKKVRIYIEHPQPYRPIFLDSLYKVGDGEAINLQVKLYNTDIIYGNVIDSQTDKGVDSVRVSIRDIATFSDEYGYYSLGIPDKYQKKFQRITFSKEGYQNKIYDSVPVHTNQTIDIILNRQND